MKTATKLLFKQDENSISMVACYFFFFLNASGFGRSGVSGVLLSDVALIIVIVFHFENCQFSNHTNKQSANQPLAEVIGIFWFEKHRQTLPEVNPRTQKYARKIEAKLSHLRII